MNHLLFDRSNNDNLSSLDNESATFSIILDDYPPVERESVQNSMTTLRNIAPVRLR